MKNKRITQKEIARRLGISRSTVSYVLGGRAEELRIAPKTVKKIQDLAGASGYIPNAMARGLIHQRSDTVGVVIDFLYENIAHHLHMGMLHPLREKGLQPIFVTRDRMPEREDAMIRWLIERCVDGIAVFQPMQESIALYRNVIQQGIPLFFLYDVPVEMPDSSYVVWDFREAVRKSVAHLAEQGCSRIGYFGHAEGCFLQAGAYKTYREALEQHGLEWNPAWTFQPLAPKYSRSILFTHEAVNLDDWLEQTFGDASAPERPDGFICGDDFVVVRLSIDLQKRGLRIPEDVALVGRGNYPTPLHDFQGLTTAVAPFNTMGRLAAEAFIELLQGDSRKKVQRVIRCDEIVVRHSTMRAEKGPVMDTREKDLLKQTDKVREAGALDWSEIDLESEIARNRSLS